MGTIFKLIFKYVEVSCSGEQFLTISLFLRTNLLELGEQFFWAAFEEMGLFGYG
jgi:hypothetical protein